MPHVTDKLLKCVYTVDCSSWREAQLQLRATFPAVPTVLLGEVLHSFTEQLHMNVHMLKGGHIMLLILTH